jgi:TM2 domain-containing membrane protein YozV
MSISVQERMLIEQRVTNDGKTNTVAYLLWFFIGIFGAHRFYLGRPGTAVLQILTLCGLGIWWIIDAFLIPGMVQEHNDRIRRAMTQQMGYQGGGDAPVDTSRWSDRDRAAQAANGAAPVYPTIDTSRWSPQDRAARAETLRRQPASPPPNPASTPAYEPTYEDDDTPFTNLKDEISLPAKQALGKLMADGFEIKARPHAAAVTRDGSSTTLGSNKAILDFAQQLGH